MRDYLGPMQPLKIVIATGGTAGHVVPALTIADALRADGHQVEFIGADRAEAELVPAAGFPFHRLSVTGLSRTNPWAALRGVGRAALAVRAAGRLLRQIDPAVVLGGGGYVAGPVGAAAVVRRIPLVLTEADSHLGLTNRLLAPVARRVCLAFPLPGRSEPRYLVTGRPVPAPQTDRAGARASLGISASERCVLVFGGSLGARSVNEAAIDGLAGGSFRVLHAAGERDLAACRQRLGSPPPEGYDLRGYISPLADALAACDLVVARSGGSVFEIAAHGKPALLVPYPHAAADHQTGNARWMADAGAAVVIADGELTADRLRTEVDNLLADVGRLSQMAEASAGLARVDAAETIAAEVVAAAGARR
jgi:UDP-N-acetylglucosamine--N-acetylmuramyl-(pentapeptide) pyrophosphoryl-undecaprenol N-acetylglucosamine transferase